VKKPARSTRRLQFEDLERREMMAVTAGLNSAGTLNVTGSAYADSLRFYQAGDVLTLTGVGSWSAGSVKSIAVDLGSGNDSVSFVTPFGGQKILADITIKSSPGVDVAHFDGHDVSLNGAGHTFHVSPGGVATVDGASLGWSLPALPGSPTTPAPIPLPTPDPAPVVAPPTPAYVPNWFDNIADSALKSLGHNLYLDNKIDRNDMLALLRCAEDGNVIDLTEFNDLKCVVGNSALFGGLDYVDQLATDVVAGNTANAHVVGITLGNLAPNSSSLQMEHMINKWFLGMDRPVAGGAYRLASGQLFVNGAVYTDINQGMLGDCYFVSTLAETALKNPGVIASMFIVNGDGTYTVRFYNNGKPQYVTVDSYLPTDASGRLIYAGMGSMYNNSGNELWVALAEKAYAQLNEIGFVRPGLSGNGQNSYAAIESGYIYAAQSQITGLGTTPFNTTGSSTSFQAFVTAYNQGKEIGFASKTNPSSSAVVGSHAYAVVGYDAVQQTVTLYNPWGIQYGLVTLSWAQVQANFSYFDRTA
jgi:hypothetical protein